MTKGIFIPILFLFCVRAQAQTPASASTQASPHSSRTPAQATFSHWLVGLSIGAAVPEGHFGVKNISDAQAGYAKTGFVAELSATYLFVPAFGIVLAFARQDNAVGAPQSLRPMGVGPPPMIEPKIHDHHWDITRIQAGFVFNQSLWSRGPSLQIRALAGSLKTALPGYDYSFPPSGSFTGSSGKIPNEPLLRAFSYQADAGFKWPLSHQLMLLVNAGYTGSKPILDQKYTITVNGTVTGSGETMATYATGTVYAQAGVSVCF